MILSIAKLLPASTRTAGDEFWVDQTREVQTETAAAYGILIASDPLDRATQLIAGRLLRRIHLTATSRGVALQHMNQITERIDREQTTSRSGRETRRRRRRRAATHGGGSRRRSRPRHRVLSGAGS